MTFAGVHTRFSVDSLHFKQTDLITVVPNRLLLLHAVAGRRGVRQGKENVIMVDFDLKYTLKFKSNKRKPHLRIEIYLIMLELRLFARAKVVFGDTIRQLKLAIQKISAPRHTRQASYKAAGLCNQYCCIYWR